MVLEVYRDRSDGRVLMGRFEGDTTKDAAFTYDDGYLAWAMPSQQLGMSEWLPLDFGSYGPDDWRPFMDGLLPEGSTLQAFAQRYQVESNDALGILSQVGCESIGALTFVADNADPDAYRPGYRHLTDEDIAEFRAHPARAVARQSADVRLSLSGAQSKVAWALPEGLKASDASLSDWLVPYGTAASTHIVKVSRPGEEDVAENELACSVLARRCGIDVARVDRVDGIPGAIAVGRYDRVWVDEGTAHHVMRLHQEDFCQALHLQTVLKYQPPGHPVSYPGLMGRLVGDVSEDAPADRVALARRFAFDFAVGNTDNHLKNSSLLYSLDWRSRRLAPSYDVTCIPLTGYSTSMAYEVGRHRTLDDISSDDVLSALAGFGVPLDGVTDVVGPVVDGLTTVDVQGCGNADAHMVQAVLRDAAPRLRVLDRVIRMSG